VKKIIDFYRKEDKIFQFIIYIQIRIVSKRVLKANINLLFNFIIILFYFIVNYMNYKYDLTP
jgi:hypothetical protein